jgi:hypothetical protein
MGRQFTNQDAKLSLVPKHAFGLVGGPSGSALTPALISAAVPEPPKFFLQESA